MGGTNPSLLEALASTDLNLLLEVGFNKEVGEDGALYFSKENKNLAELIDSVDYLSEEDIKSLSSKAKARIISSYQWNSIINLYESLFNY